MTTVKEQREKLTTQSNMYDRMIRANKTSKRNAEKRIGILRKKKNESDMLKERYRFSFEKLNRINSKFSYMKFLCIFGATSALKIVQLALGIFSLSGVLSIPVGVMYAVLALSIGFKGGIGFFESHFKGKYRQEERASNTYQLHINKLEKELENYVAENKRIGKKKAVVDAGIKEIDEHVGLLLDSTEEINVQNLNDNLSDESQVNNVTPYLK